MIKWDSNMIGNMWKGMGDEDELLDKERGYVLPRTEVPRFSTELVQLKTLQNGMVLLCSTVQSAQDQLSPQQAEKGTYYYNYDISCAIGGQPGLLESFFQWYAMSATKYAALVFVIAHESGLIAKNGKDAYLKEVLGPITKYRHKVAAHFARTDPLNDSVEFQRLSVMVQVSLFSGLFAVGCFDMLPAQPEFDEPPVFIPKRQDFAWSITEMHGLLARRYGWNGFVRPKESSSKNKMTSVGRISYRQGAPVGDL